jgi:flagellar basal body rod protein FlgC
MGFLGDMKLDTEKTGSDIRKVYYRIPRKSDENFHKPHGRNHVNFDVEIWADKETSKEKYDPENPKVIVKKPIRVINVRLVDLSHDEIHGQKYVPAVYLGIGPERTLITPAIPEIPGARAMCGKDEYLCSYHDVIDKVALKQFVKDDKSDDDMDEIEAKGIVTQFYDYVSTETDFCGIDMTNAERY